MECYTSVESLGSIAAIYAFLSLNTHTHKAHVASPYNESILFPAFTHKETMNAILVTHTRLRTLANLGSLCSHK